VSNIRFLFGFIVSEKAGTEKVDQLFSRALFEKVETKVKLEVDVHSLS
jgi:hypothetical protein